MINELIFAYPFIVSFVIQVILLILTFLIDYILRVKEYNAKNKSRIMNYEFVISSIYTLDWIVSLVFGLGLYFFNIVCKNLIEYLGMYLILLASFPLKIYSYTRLIYYQSRDKYDIHNTMMATRFGRAKSLNLNTKAIMISSLIYYLAVSISLLYLLKYIYVDQCSSIVFLCFILLTSVFIISIFYFQTKLNKRKFLFYIFSILSQIFTFVSIFSFIILTSCSQIESMKISGMFFKIILIVSYLLKNPKTKKEFYNQDITKLSLINEICKEYNSSNMKIAIINTVLGSLFYLITIFLK